MRVEGCIQDRSLRIRVQVIPSLDALRRKTIRFEPCHQLRARGYAECTEARLEG